jgi:hypothetical protein
MLNRFAKSFTANPRARFTASRRFNTRRHLVTSSYAAVNVDYSTTQTDDTIFQLSSGSNRSGVAVVRLSGEHALAAALKLTRRRATPPPRVATMCRVYDPATRELLDTQALFLSFPAPASFTGESVVELHVHGAPIVVDGVLEALGKLDGHAIPGAATNAAAAAAIDTDTAASSSSSSSSSSTNDAAVDADRFRMRLATAGEFTRRAFESGKFDLTQVEGLADLLNAETKQQRKQAAKQLRGALTKTYDAWRSELMRSLAYCEAVIVGGASAVVTLICVLCTLRTQSSPRSICNFITLYTQKIKNKIKYRTLPTTSTTWARRRCWRTYCRRCARSHAPCEGTSTTRGAESWCVAACASLSLASQTSENLRY